MHQEEEGCITSRGWHTAEAGQGFEVEEGDEEGREEQQEEEGGQARVG